MKIMCHLVIYTSHKKSIHKSSPNGTAFLVYSRFLIKGLSILIQPLFVSIGSFRTLATLVMGGSKNSFIFNSYIHKLRLIELPHLMFFL